MQSRTSVTVILLKTRSQPDDNYEDYFQTYHDRYVDLAIEFRPSFVPVLEHKQNEAALSSLGSLLQSGQLKEKYGGMIFTSQRAVEAWSDMVLSNAEGNDTQGLGHHHGNVDAKQSTLNDTPETSEPATRGNQAIDERSGQSFATDIQDLTEFPLYTVGPATSRALKTLITTTQSEQTGQASTDNTTKQQASSKFLALRPTVLGAHTGNGANLATFILQHYNELQAEKWFTFYEAPRLPFIPLIGMGSENYSRKRLESNDPRLTKKPLLFLVGEQRRDIIPKTLHNAQDNQAIQVEEVEVYKTTVKDFQTQFTDLLPDPDKNSDPSSKNTIVIVVFSPQGCPEMLKSIGYTDDKGKVDTEKIESQWSSGIPSSPRYIIVTIGPTTRDYLVTLGVEPDLCASSPSPEGIGDVLLPFLREKRIIT